MTDFNNSRFPWYCLALVAFLTGKTAFAFANDADNIAILRFEGMKVLPHENQLTLKENRWEPGSRTTTAVTYILACDKKRGDVYCYARESLWRIDTASIDVESEFMRIWCDIGLLSYVDNAWKVGEPPDLWFLSMRTIFADVFALPIETSRDNLVDAIHQSVGRRVFPGRSEWNRCNQLVRHRSVAKDGEQVVVNLFQNNEIISATRADLVTSEEQVAECKEIVFKGNKPWEIRQGQVKRMTANKLPEEIQELIDMEGKTIAEKWSLASADRAQVVSVKPAGGHGDLLKNWANSLLVIWITVVGLSIVFRGCIVSKRSIDDEKS